MVMVIEFFAASVLGCWVRRPPGELKVMQGGFNSLVSNWGRVSAGLVFDLDFAFVNL